jgi:hypothetical protein
MTDTYIDLNGEVQVDRRAAPRALRLPIEDTIFGALDLLEYQYLALKSPEGCKLVGALRGDIARLLGELRPTPLQAPKVTAGTALVLCASTGAPLLECKAALVAYDGDTSKAAHWLRATHAANAQ